MHELSDKAEALWRAATGTQGGVEPPRERLLPMLVELSNVAPPKSEAWVDAHRELSTLLYVEDPWRAAICARRVIEVEPHDEVAWAILGVAQASLGNHEFAIRAFRKALRRAPRNPWYAHNLGHLLDVCANLPGAAVPLLRTAVESLYGWRDVGWRHLLEMKHSLAHALFRVGELHEARQLLLDVVRSGRAQHNHHELYREVTDAYELAVEQLTGRAQSSADRRIQRREHTRPH